MLTSGLNPNIVKTALDGLFMPEYNLYDLPEIATANDPFIFNQMNSTKAVEVMEEYTGVGEWESRGELQDAAEAQPRSRYQNTFTNAALAKGVTIPKRFFDDDQWGMVQKTIRDFAEKGRRTRDKDALSVYRDNPTGGDGVALFATNHPTNAGTVSNLITPKISESGLNTGIIALGEMLARDDMVMGHTPHCLLVPYPLFKNAGIILDTELRSGTANNDLNFYSSRYGIYLKTSVYLGDIVSGGDDDAWYLLSRNHSIIRFNREEVNTRMLDWTVTKNRSYFYDGEFRQSVGAMGYEGALKSDGSTGSYDA